MTFLAPQLKLFCHSKEMADFISKGRTDNPVNVEISPNNFCNANCPWCFYRISNYKVKHSREEINIDVLKAALTELAAMGCKAISWTGGGEPSIYSHFDEAAEFAHKLGFKQGLFTNGYKAIAKPELFEWIRISLTDKLEIPPTAKIYSSKTKTGINLNLTPENAVEIERLIKSAKEAGVKYFQIRPALAETVDKQKKVELPPHLKTYNENNFTVLLTEYKFDDYTKGHGYGICHGHNLVPFIWHNGDVNVCAYHFAKDEYIFGNLNKQSFKQIWLGEKRKKMILDGIKVSSMCQHCCKNHEINKVMYNLGNISDRDFV